MGGPGGTCHLGSIFCGIGGQLASGATGASGSTVWRERSGSIINHAVWGGHGLSKFVACALNIEYEQKKNIWGRGLHHTACGCSGGVVSVVENIRVSVGRIC
jgi:hypothetical protein